MLRKRMSDLVIFIINDDGVCRSANGFAGVCYVFKCLNIFEYYSFLVFFCSSV